MRKISNFRNVFGKKLDLLSDKHKDYLQIPKLKREKNFPKLQKDLKKLSLTANIPKEQFASLNELMGFV